MIQKLIEIAFSGLFEFIGVFLLCYIFFHFIGNLLSRILRMIMVCKHGWPPEHLDADGDWKPEPEEK